MKYGALSNDDGKVSIRWAEGEGDAFTLEWLETGGPAVVAPARSGFGSRLTSRIVAGYFRGKGDLMYEPTGLRYVLSGRIERVGSSDKAE